MSMSAPTICPTSVVSFPQRAHWNLEARMETYHSPSLHDYRVRVRDAHSLDVSLTQDHERRLTR
jgi:hypothetical protein